MTELQRKGLIDGLLWNWICDWKNGADVFKVVADSGNPGGMFWFGVCLFFGYGVKKNLQEANRYFEMTFEYGDSFWVRQKSKICRLGYFGYNEDDKAADYFEEIANSKPTYDTSFFNPGFF